MFVYGSKYLADSQTEKCGNQPSVPLQTQIPFNKTVKKMLAPRYGREPITVQKTLHFSPHFHNLIEFLPSEHSAERHM